jgi:radical SAM superfamily enzyme YgiQ (UPF0313 family)
MARAVRVTREAGMFCGASFMFGYPGETKQTISDTVEFCRRHALRLDGLYYTTPYPGTPIYSEFEQVILNRFGSKEQFISQLGDTRTFVVNLTDFNDEELVRLHDQALAAINHSRSC